MGRITHIGQLKSFAYFWLERVSCRREFKRDNCSGELKIYHTGRLEICICVRLEGFDGSRLERISCGGILEWINDS